MTSINILILSNLHECSVFVVHVQRILGSIKRFSMHHHFRYHGTVCQESGRDIGRIFRNIFIVLMWLNVNRFSMQWRKNRIVKCYTCECVSTADGRLQTAEMNKRNEWNERREKKNWKEKPLTICTGRLLNFLTLFVLSCARLRECVRNITTILNHQIFHSWKCTTRSEHWTNVRLELNTKTMCSISIEYLVIFLRLSSTFFILLSSY